MMPHQHQFIFIRSWNPNFSVDSLDLRLCSIGLYVFGFFWFGPQYKPICFMWSFLLTNHVFLSGKWCGKD